MSAYSHGWRGTYKTNPNEQVDICVFHTRARSPRLQRVVQGLEERADSTYDVQKVDGKTGMFEVVSLTPLTSGWDAVNIGLVRVIDGQIWANSMARDVKDALEREGISYKAAKLTVKRSRIYGRRARKIEFEKSDVYAQRGSPRLRRKR